jgi:hypothetical protein
MADFKKYEPKSCPFFMGVYQSGALRCGVIVQAESLLAAADFLRQQDNIECFEFYEANNVAFFNDNFENIIGRKPLCHLGYRSAQSIRWEQVKI